MSQSPNKYHSKIPIQPVSQAQHTPPPTKENNIAVPELSLNDIKVFDKGIRSTNMLEAKIVAGVDKEFTFKILEIQIHDQLTTENVTAYTIGQYEIYSDSHIPWGTYNVNTLYQVRRGKPIFWIGDEGKTIKAGSFICVPAGVRHSMYNQSDSVNAVVDMIFPGKIVAPVQKK